MARAGRACALAAPSHMERPRRQEGRPKRGGARDVELSLRNPMCSGASSSRCYWTCAHVRAHRPSSELRRAHEYVANWRSRGAGQGVAAYTSEVRFAVQNPVFFRKETPWWQGCSCSACYVGFINRGCSLISQ